MNSRQPYFKMGNQKISSYFYGIYKPISRPQEHCRQLVRVNVYAVCCVGKPHVSLRHSGYRLATLKMKILIKYFSD